MIRTLLVDDEQPARDRLRQLLHAFSDVEILDEAKDGDEAVEKIRGLVPDLVFLDIQMPGRTGLDVVAALTPPRPRVIFCTAFDQYAVNAFELHAVDYLLKPVSRRRLETAIGRVRDILTQQETLVRDLESACEVQARLLPRVLPSLQTLDYSAASRAARGVTGDYYDFLSIDPDRLGIALGDVSGKGVPAGLLMASLQGRLQSHAPLRGEAVADLIGDLNRLMFRSTDSNRYITFFYGLYHDRERTLTYVNAGHNPPLWLRAADSEMVRLGAGGAVVGLLPDAVYTQETIRLQVGDVLVWFTDGLTEAENNRGEEFGESRLSQIIRASVEIPAGALLERILAAVDEFVGAAPQRDDITAIAARVSR